MDSAHYNITEEEDMKAEEEYIQPRLRSADTHTAPSRKPHGKEGKTNSLRKHNRTHNLTRREQQ